MLSAAFAAIACGSKKPEAPAQPPPLSSNAYAHYVRGRVAAIEGDTSRAALEFGRAAQAAPDEPEIIVAYVEALLSARRANDAAAVGLKASERWPKRADVALVTGRALRKLRRMPEAIASLERAVKLDSESDDAALELAAALVADNKADRAVAVYRKLAARDPDATTPRIRLARLLLDSGDPKAAGPVIEEVLSTRPSHTGARMLHSRIRAAVGDKAGATKTLIEGFANSQRKSRFARKVFARLMDASEHERAAAFAVGLDSPALSPDVRALLGQLLLRVGQPGRALEIGKRIRKSDPGSTEAALLVGNALARLRRFAEAAKAVRSVPLTGFSRILAAEWLALAGQSAEGIALAAELDAEDSRRAYIVARVHELGGNEARARTTFADAVKKFPDDVDLIFEAASFELRSGKTERAVELAEPLLEDQPDDASLANFVGFALAEAGRDLSRAERLLKIALRQHPDDPNVLDSLGWLQFRQKQLSQAAETLRHAWRLSPAQPEILFHLARVEDELGLENAAKRRYRTAFNLAIEPTLRRRIKNRIGSRFGFSRAVLAPRQR